MIKKNKITAAMILLGLTGGILTGAGGCIVKGAAETGPLKVTLLKVGKADAIAIQTEKNTMVIDTGEYVRSRTARSFTRSIFFCSAIRW